MTQPFDRPQSFDLQGHRGARALLPENTIEGFAATTAIGVDSIELDIAITADNIPVVTHDPRLNPDLTRTPDGAWLETTGPAIRSLTLTQLRTYDVGRIKPGSRTATLFPDQRPIDGARIPTLLDVLRATPGTRIDAELKTNPADPDLTVSPQAMADAVIAVASEAGALSRLAIRSFDWRGLAYLLQTHPQIPLAWLTSPQEESARALWWNLDDVSGTTPQAVAQAARGASLWTPAWAANHKSLTPQIIAEAHSIGLRVAAWTVNDPTDMARLLDWGVNSICSDRPDLLRAVYDARQGK